MLWMGGPVAHLLLSILLSSLWSSYGPLCLSYQYIQYLILSVGITGELGVQSRINNLTRATRGDTDHC